MINYSIIIPHKNTPKLLQRCLDSIPQRGDIEVIVVDNNSSPDVVDFDHFPGCGRNDVLLVRDDESIGAGGARNTGLTYAQGKWVLFADADDYYERDYLSALDKYIDSDNDVIYFNYNVKKKDKNGYGIVNAKSKYDYTIDNFDIDVLKYRLTVPWNKMIRKCIIDKYHILFEDCVVGNDVFFSYQIGALTKQVIYEEKRLYNYTLHKNSVTTKKKNNNDFYFAKLSHNFQGREFFKLIGHPEWGRSLFLKYISLYYHYGFIQFLKALKVYICYYDILDAGKTQFVDHIIMQKSIDENGDNND